MKRRCIWCSQEFTPRNTGGSPQKFCNRRCKRAYERSLRLWASKEYSKGTLKAAGLQHTHSLETEKDEW